MPEPTLQQLYQWKEALEDIEEHLREAHQSTDLIQDVEFNPMVRDGIEEALIEASMCAGQASYKLERTLRYREAEENA